MRLFSIIIILLLLINPLVKGQELKKKKKLKGDYLEEYFVLKKDKKIKHGLYVKYQINSLGRKGIKEMGYYNNDKRTGNWFFFDFGYLEKEGLYKNGNKIGLWIEYYTLIKQDSNAIRVINSAFEVNKGITITDKGEVLVDISNLIKSSEGVYQNDLKIGAWNYYDNKGFLVHKFDYSSSQLLLKNYVNLTDSMCPYLGGCDRFFDEYRKYTLTLPKEPTKISFKIESKPTGLSVKTISLTGNNQLAEDVKSILSKMDNDFLFINNKPIILNIDSKGYSGSMFGELRMYFGNKNANKTYE